MSKIPEQLQKQVDAAENFYKTDDANKSVSENETVNMSTSENSPASESQVVGKDAQNEVVNTAVVEDENNETYAQRWRSQQGIVASANQKLGYAEQRIQQLESLISNMQNTLPPTKDVEDKKYLTDKDREEYGADMVDFVNRAVAEGTTSLKQENQMLLQELNRLRGVVPAVQQVVRQQQVSKEDAFWSSLSREVTDWEAVNSKQQFKDWLLQADPMTGITRDVYLKDAQKDLDVFRVANIFNVWKQQFSVPSTSKTEVARKSVQNELEMQVAPGSKTSTSASDTTEAKKWSNQEIGKFYDDARKGVFKGRDTEFKAIQADIFQARKVTA